MAEVLVGDCLRGFHPLVVPANTSVAVSANDEGTFFEHPAGNDSKTMKASEKQRTILFKAQGIGEDEFESFYVKADLLPSGQGGGCDVKLLIDGKEKILPTKTDEGIRQPNMLLFLLFSNVLLCLNAIVENVHFQK